MLTCAPDPAARSLRARWAQLDVSEPELDLERAAERLGVAPLALVEARTHDGFLPLLPEWSAMTSNLCAFGRVSVRTSRPGCVLEVAGTFAGPRITPDQLSFDGPQITLHADPRRWRRAFAFELMTRVRTRRGVTFFGDDGEQAWSLELITGSNRGVLDAFVDVFGDRRETVPLVRAAHAPPPATCATLEQLATSWAATGRADLLLHLLWRHGFAYERVQRQARALRARRLPTAAVFELLARAFERGQWLCATSGSSNATLAGRLGGEPREAGAWWNVIGADAALHLRADQIGEVWRVQGRRSTLEVFDRERRPLLSLAEWSERDGCDSTAWKRLLLAVGAERRAS